MNALLLAAVIGFTLREPLMHKEGNYLFMGITIMNGFNENVHNVRVTSIEIRSQPSERVFTGVLIDPPPPPHIWLGDIAPRNRKSFAARWLAEGFRNEGRYVLSISGTYDDATDDGLSFQVETEFKAPKNTQAKIPANLNIPTLSLVGVAHAADAPTPKLRPLDATAEGRFDNASGLWVFSIVNDSKDFINGLSIELIPGVSVEIVASPRNWTGYVSPTGRSVYWIAQEEDKPSMAGPGKTLGGFAIRALNGSQRFVTTPYALVTPGSAGKVATGRIRTPDNQ